MNRIIKFRAWTLQSYSDPESDCYKKKGEMVSWKEIQDDRNKWLDSERFGKEFILMQFTGLHDKNGKEIYEGDVVQRILNNKRQKKFSVLYGSWGLSFKEEAMGDGWLCREFLLNPGLLMREEVKLELENFEVIGNIYENPELLK